MSVFTIPKVSCGYQENIYICMFYWSYIISNTIYYYINVMQVRFLIAGNSYQTTARKTALSVAQEFVCLFPSGDDFPKIWWWNETWIYLKNVRYKITSIRFNYTLYLFVRNYLKPTCWTATARGCSANGSPTSVKLQLL